MKNEIILRSVYGKVGQKYFIQPCPNPQTGRFADCVKNVNKDGDMILSESEKEKMSRGEAHYIKITHIFVIEDGYKLNLDDLIDYSIWEAIKHTDLIAPERGAKDAQGNLLIDGSRHYYGAAELYVERPGEATKTRVNRKKIQFTAQQYIYNDSEEQRVKKCKVLGRDLRAAPPADVLDYLLSISEKDPQRIINLYEDEDWKLELFIIDAIERGVLIKRNGIYQYGDKLLGASKDAVISMFKDIKYKNFVNTIKKETYPEYLPKSEIEKIEKSVTEGIPHADTTKDTKKKK